MSFRAVYLRLALLRAAYLRLRCFALRICICAASRCLFAFSAASRCLFAFSAALSLISSSCFLLFVYKERKGKKECVAKELRWKGIALPAENSKIFVGDLILRKWRIILRRALRLSASRKICMYVSLRHSISSADARMPYLGARLKNDLSRRPVEKRPISAPGPRTTYLGPGPRTTYLGARLKIDLSQTRFSFLRFCSGSTTRF